MNGTRNEPTKGRGALTQRRLTTAAITGATACLAVLAPLARAEPLSGKALFAQHCEQCHRAVDSQDFGNVGPSLVDVRSRYPDDQAVAAIIRDEPKRNPQTVMPPFGRHRILTEQEIRAIVGYLYSQRPLMANERGDR